MKLKNIILLGTAVMALSACDDLFEPALENNLELSEMYSDPQFARGLIDNAFLVLPYDGSSVSRPVITPFSIVTCSSRILSR